ncbi:aminoglycoside phosphotransferase family protein [Streptomyces showdoensis]|uniref:Aminoglycoside phosphotransferase n=1 Tax=Streptomyces showdoensis TaxID=68268 RepID=A0A2P2GCM0_STREW|nr:aminoglycoside phosphotransferase family protein [Streptomyces showdoensis]KKZ69201.1 aminoglycoside phosphotransferase [Streptomyces showdoensis]
MEETGLVQLHALARATAHPGASSACPCATGVLADRDDGTVVRHGRLVVKSHAPGGDTEELRSRVGVAALPALAEVLLPPLPGPRAALDGRLVTAWPYGTPVDPEHPEAAPWEEAGRLLALLHLTPPPPGLPPMRAPLKAALAVERMRRTAPDHPAAATVLDAWRTLPPRAESRSGGSSALCHGDFHLGQLVRAPHWRLIDVDDLGVGDPAWDLARPAAWFAAGLLPPEVWSRFLGAYEGAGGPATRSPATGGPTTGRAGSGAPGGDPWARLDVPARALTVQTAALALAKSTAEGRPLDEVEHVMVDTCARIASIRTELVPPASP